MKTSAAAHSSFESKLERSRERRTFDEFTPFWDAYNAEAESYDKELIKEWASDLDALLIFAGLFASVNTAFIIESYKKLQVDPAEENTLLLRNILHRLDNSTFSAEELRFPKFHATGDHIRINCLFFASLSFSLFAAFGAVLAKQWLSQYEGGDARVRLSSDRAKKRHQKLRGLERWYLRPVVETLPTLLQISLFLFLVGLVNFLWMIEKTVSHVVLIISVILFAFYSFTTLISVFSHDAPFRTRFSASLQGLVDQLRRPKAPSLDDKVLGDEDKLREEDNLREECVAWVLHGATLPSTIRTVCKAISMLPPSKPDSLNSESLYDWSVITRYLRTIIANGAVLADVPIATLPSALEVLYQLIRTSKTRPSAGDSALISKELITILSVQLYEQPASSVWILKILRCIYSDDRGGLRGMVTSLRQGLTRAGVRNPDANFGGIIDELLLLLKKAVETEELKLALEIVDMLRNVAESGPVSLELEEEETIRFFLILLAHPSLSIITTADRTSVLSLASILIRGVIRRRVEKAEASSQNPSIITAAAAETNVQFRGTLDVLQQLLKTYSLDAKGWELDLLVLFRSSLQSDIETSARIIQVLGHLAQNSSRNWFQADDVVAFETFLTNSSKIVSDVDWISASILVLFVACKGDASAAVGLLTASDIPTSDLGNLFLRIDSVSEIQIRSTARLEMGCRWLRRQPDSTHLLFQENGWSKDLRRYGDSGHNDIYLRTLKDLLSCAPRLWYSRLVTDGHLEALRRIASISNDDKSCDWMACFLFMALWRWHWVEASKFGNKVNVFPFFTVDVVKTIIDFFISSRGRITRWNVERFGSRLDEVTSFRETVLSANTYLQAIASIGLIPEESAKPLEDGYRRWTTSISDYLSEVRETDLQIWGWTHGADVSLFRVLGQALGGHGKESPELGDIQSSSQEVVLPTTAVYLIRSVRSGSVLHCSLDSRGTGLGRQVINHHELGTPNQKWILSPVSPGVYLIQNVATRTYLTYPTSSPQATKSLKDGTAFVSELVFRPTPHALICCDDVPSSWELKPVAEHADKVLIVLSEYPDLAIDLVGNLEHDGASFILFGMHGEPNQQYVFEQVDE